MQGGFWVKKKKKIVQAEAKDVGSVKFPRATCSPLCYSSGTLHRGRAAGPAHCIKRSFGLISAPVVFFSQLLDKGSLSATEKGWHCHAVKWELIDILLGTNLRPWATQLLCKEGESWAQSYICLTQCASLSPKWIFLVRCHFLARCFCQPFLPRRLRWVCLLCVFLFKDTVKVLTGGLPCACTQFSFLLKDSLTFPSPPLKKKKKKTLLICQKDESHCEHT